MAASLVICSGVFTAPPVGSIYKARCSVPFEAVPSMPFGLPPLSVVEANSIASSAFLLWATIFCWKKLEQLL